jgi:hypothetical protein
MRKSALERDNDVGDLTADSDGAVAGWIKSHAEERKFRE